MWKIIDWLSEFLCRHGFHEWSEWKANTYSKRVIWDWTRECERCREHEWAGGDISPTGQPHPGSTY